MHGRFQAVHVGGAGTTTWTCPTAVSDEGFGEALAAAVRETGFTGRRVAIVLEHRSLLFHVQETPPARGRDLKQLLQRLVAQSRFFEEPASWGRTPLPAAKGKSRHLLALVPASLLRQLRLACLAHRLHLVSVFPVAAPLSEELRKLSAGKEEVVIMAAEFPGSLDLLLGRGDGQILFSRNVALSGAQKAERAVQEINRTLQYAQQQFGAVVNQLFVLGDGAFATLKDHPIREGLRTTRGAGDSDLFHLARVAAALPVKHPLNLARDGQASRLAVRRWAAAALLALVAGTAATVGTVESLVQGRERKASELERQLDAQAQSQQSEAARQREFRQLSAFVHTLDPAEHPPVPELLARHLATHWPSSFRLGELEVHRETNGWRFEIQGFTRDQPSASAALIEGIEKAVGGSPLKARVTDSTRRRLMQGGPGGPGSVSGQPEERSFFLSGVIE